MVFSLPFRIGKNVSVKGYNTFVYRNESTGYKFYWEDKNVYIIEMANADRGAVVSLLADYFKVPNNGTIIGPPIKVLGQPCKRFPFNMFGLWPVISIHNFFPIDHYNSIGQGEKMAPDVTVYPGSAHVPQPGIPHPDPPPSDINVLLVSLVCILFV